MSVPTRFGMGPSYRLSKALGYDPDAQTDDLAEPIDRAIAGVWEAVRATDEYSSVVDVNLASLGATVTDGGGSRTFTNPGNANDNNAGTSTSRASYANGASTSILRSDLGVACLVSAMVLDFNGTSANTGWTAEHSDDGASWTSVGAGTNVGGSTGYMEWTITPTLARYWRVIQTEGGSGFHAGITIETWSITGQQLVAAGVEWTLAPEVHDEDDATYRLVEDDDDGAVLRAMLEEPYRLGSITAKLGMGSAGATSYDLEGATVADFSDAEVVETLAFTATGSYTMDTVTAALPATTAYQFYRLVGPADVRFYTVTLYEPITDLALYQLRSEKGNANGYASLDGSGLVPLSQLPPLGGLPWFDVTDYGAVGDGSTDDRADVNDAIAALNASGAGVLYFPGVASGDYYYVSDALTAITVPCTIMGDGGGSAGPSVIGLDHATANLFTLSANNIRVTGLKLVNINGSESAGAAIATTTGAGANNRYDNLWIEGFYDGLSLIYGYHWSMHACEITNPVRYGVRIANVDIPDGGDWSMSNCWFGTRSRNATAAIRQESAGGGKMVNVKINCNTAADQATYSGVKMYVTGHHVYINGAANNTSVMTTVGCSIENVSGDAILIQTNGTGRFGLVSITGLEVGLYNSNNTGRAVKVSAASTGGFDAGGGGGIGGVTIDGLTARTDGTARAAVELINTDEVYLGSIALVTNFTSRYTSSGDTNTTDGGGGGDPALGGDLSGTASAAVVEAVQGVAVTDAGTTGDRLEKTGAAAATWVTPPDTDGLIVVDGGTYTVDTGSPPAVTLESDWGIDGGGLPYYDDTGADAGEEAALCWDPVSDHYVLVAYGF